MNLEAMRESLPKRLLLITDDIRKQGGTPYLVGGWVRDAMLGFPTRDYDIEVYGMEQDALLEILKCHGKPNLVGKSYGVINLYSKGIQYDFSFPRLESKVGVGHRAFAVETRTDLDFRTASTRRDFTINAMGMELPSLQLIDPHDGAGDLERKLLKHVGPAFAEDPLRVLRGVQFAARFELHLHPSTIELCKTLDLKELSRERLFEELRKWLLKSSQPSMGLIAFQQLELVRFFPELQIPQAGLGDWMQNLDAVQKSSELLPEDLRLQVRFVALCRGCSSVVEVQSFLELLTQEIQILEGVPKLWMELQTLRKAIKDQLHLQLPWLRRSALRTPLRASYALISAEQNCVEIQDLAKQDGIWEKGPEPLLTGKMLLSLGQKPGPWFGEWIRENFELQLNGEICSAEEALKWAMQKLKNS